MFSLQVPVFYCLSLVQQDIGEEDFIVTTLGMFLHA